MARDPHPDRPSLDPEFVANQTFSTSFRGFDTAEVRGYLEVIAGLLRDGETREEELTQELAAAQERLANPPPLDEHQVTMLLGEETTRVIETARQAAVDIRTKSEENASRLVRQAMEEAAGLRSAAEAHVLQMRAEADQEVTAARTAADEYAVEIRGGADEEISRRRAEVEADTARMRQEAESVLAVRTAEAEGVAAEIKSEAEHLRDAAALEVETLRAAVAEEVAGQRAEVAASAESEIETARQQGRAMVAEARTVRERMLTDLVERRRLGRAHLDHLRGTREWMLEVLESARGRLEQAAEDLAAPLASDRTATEAVSPQDIEDDALLEAMMSAAPAPDPAVVEPAVVEPAVVEPAVAGPAVLEPAAVEPALAEEPMPASEPEPEPVVELHPEPEPAEPPVATTAGASAGEEGEAADIDALFAKIRAARTADVQHAQEVLVDLTDAPPAHEGPGVDVVVDLPIAPAATDAQPLRPDFEGPAQLATLLERRDAATDEIERQLARRLKRILSDEQNELLDQVRRTKGVPTEDVLPALDAHAARYAEVAASDLAGAVAVGSSFYGAPSGPVSTKVDDIAAQLAEELVRQLRGRLTRCFSDAGGDEAELGERIRACYREWKTQRIADTSRHFVLAAFTRGLFDAAPAASAFRWIVDDGGTPCPDAEDNALQGEVSKGEPFPTGDAYPPAHPGCRCLIVPVEAAVISRA